MGMSEAHHGSEPSTLRDRLRLQADDGSQRLRMVPSCTIVVRNPVIRQFPPVLLKL